MSHSHETTTPGGLWAGASTPYFYLMFLQTQSYSKNKAYLNNRQTCSYLKNKNQGLRFSCPCLRFRGLWVDARRPGELQGKGTLRHKDHYHGGVSGNEKSHDCFPVSRLAFWVLVFKNQETRQRSSEPQKGAAPLTLSAAPRGPHLDPRRSKEESRGLPAGVRSESPGGVGP